MTAETKRLIGGAMALPFLLLPVLVHFVTRNYEITFYFFAGELIAGALWALIILRTMIRPIVRLTHYVDQIRSNNLDASLPTPAGDDDAIEKLAAALHSLTASLRESRLQDQHDLLRTQETTRAAINSLPHAVAVLSPEGKIELVNRVAQEFFGLVPGQPPPVTAQKWLLPLFEKMSQTQKAVEPRGFESAVQVFDQGLELFFLPHAIPIVDPQGKTAGITIVLVDATGLHQIDEAKSGVLATVSHELKTPLTSIQMALHLLLDDPPPALAPRHLDLLKTAAADADRLHQLIQSTLDAARKIPPVP